MQNSLVSDHHVRCYFRPILGAPEPRCECCPNTGLFSTAHRFKPGLPKVSYILSLDICILAIKIAHVPLSFNSLDVLIAILCDRQNIAMSLRPSKRDDPNYVYHINDSTPSSKSLPIDRRVSFAFDLPPRALVPKSNDMTFPPTPRPKGTSYPSRRAGVCRDQYPKLVSRPSGSASADSDSMAAQSGSFIPSPRMMPAEHERRKGQSEEDDDDESIIVIKVPRQTITSPSPSNVNSSKLSTGHQLKTANKALSVDNLRGERDTYGQAYIQEKRCSSGTELKGLMEVMRLESLLLLLKKYLNLYHDFDESSGGM